MKVWVCFSETVSDSHCDILGNNMRCDVTCDNMDLVCLQTLRLQNLRQHYIGRKSVSCSLEKKCLDLKYFAATCSHFQSLPDHL